jgi:hypothetical protein
MTLALLYWILMLGWLVFGLWSNWGPAPNHKIIGGNVLTFLLFLCLGWRVFGPPLHQ